MSDHTRVHEELVAVCQRSSPATIGCSTGFMRFLVRPISTLVPMLVEPQVNGVLGAELSARLDLASRTHLPSLFPKLALRRRAASAQQMPQSGSIIEGLELPWGFFGASLGLFSSFFGASLGLLSSFFGLLNDILYPEVINL